MELKASVQKHIEWLEDLSADDPYTIFLCGPALPTPSKGKGILSFDWAKSFFRLNRPSASAELRRRLIDDLTESGFDVVLGEDDGLENNRIKVGLNAQDNELEFVSRYCNAVIIIADSVGAFCELGLFSWHFVHKEGKIGQKDKPVFVVLINDRYAGSRSYFNEGPVRSVLGFGHVFYINYNNYEIKNVIDMVANHRVIEIMNKKGARPGKKK